MYDTRDDLAHAKRTGRLASSHAGNCGNKKHYTPSIALAFFDERATARLRRNAVYLTSVVSICTNTASCIRRQPSSARDVDCDFDIMSCST